MNESAAAIEVMKKIVYNDGEAYLVGGCVRDMILGREPNDYDIATNLLPDDIVAIFDKVIPTGIEHLTVTVVYKGHNIEVTTFREEGGYTDGRHPDTVIPADTIEEDLARRDFTMNAIAFSPWDGLIDPYDGKKDIDSMVIRCVGDPEDRIDEDKLRALRAIRFACQLDFRIDNQLWMTIADTTLEQISKERIRDELIKILESDYPQHGIADIMMSDINNEVIPELDNLIDLEGGDHHGEDVFTHSMLSLKYSKEHTDDWRVRLACLLHDIGKYTTYEKDDEGNLHFYKHEHMGAEIAEECMKRLKVSNEDIEYVFKLIKYHMFVYGKTIKNKNKKTIRRLVNHLNRDEPMLWDLLIVQYVDHKANLALKTADFDTYIKDYTIWDDWQEIKEEDDTMQVTDLNVDGYDMMEIGFEGPEIGKILEHLLNLVWEETIENKHNELMEKAKEIYYDRF